MANGLSARLGTDGEPPSDGGEGGWLGRGLDDSTVALAVALVDKMAVMDKVTEWSAEEHPGPGGRPELFPKSVVLVGMAICALTAQPLHLRRVRDVLFRQLSARWRNQLRLPEPPLPDDWKRWKALERDVRTRFHAIVDLMDPSPLPRNRRLDDAAFMSLAESRRAQRSETAWRQRGERLEWFANRVLEASFSLLPREHRRRWKGSIGVDATLVRAFARRGWFEEDPRGRRSKPTYRAVVHSADPDAGVYKRPPDERDEQGGGRREEKRAYGYEATLAVAVPDDPADAGRFPALALGMATLHRPGHEPGRNGTRAVAAIRARGHPANWLAVDIAYSSAKAEDFQLPVRAVGYRPVFAYKEGQFGVKDNVQGFIQVEGCWSCPMMPDALVAASADRRAKRIDPDTYERRIAERRQYRARRKQAPDTDGYERLGCPAAGPSPLVRCDLKPRSLRSTTRGRLHIQPNASLRALPPPCCTNETVTVPPAAGAKFAQELAYQSPEWRARYGAIRNANEGFHGYVKDPNYEALDNAGRRRVHGVAAQTVFTAFLLMAANVRKVRAFLEGVAHEAGKLKRLPRRRKTRPLRDWLPSVDKVEPESDPDPPVTV